MVVTTRQTEDLIATFQDRFRQLKNDHKADLHKLMHGSDQDRLYNQKYIERLCKTYKKKMTELDSDYRICIAEMEDKHQKKIVSILFIIMTLSPISYLAFVVCYAVTGTAEEGYMY